MATNKLKITKKQKDSGYKHVTINFPIDVVEMIGKDMQGEDRNFGPHVVHICRTYLGAKNEKKDGE